MTEIEALNEKTMSSNFNILNKSANEGEESDVSDISYHSSPDIEHAYVMEICNNAEGNNNLTYKDALKLLTPQHSERLYAKIIRAKDIDNVIHHWLNIYQVDKDKGIHELYQLYVDLASYQFINVHNYLNVQNHNVDELITYLEKRHNDIITTTGKYFLFIRNKSYLLKHAKIEMFILNFIAMCAKEKIIYDFNLLCKIIHFCVLMSKSHKRSIKHTGVYLGLKHQTGLIKISVKIAQKILSVQNTLKNVNDQKIIEYMQNKIEKLKNYDDQINKLINVLQLSIFKGNWNFMDKTLYFMREDCFTELYKWIEIFPGRNLHTENINFILNATEDMHKIVRYKALQNISSIVENYSSIIRLKFTNIITFVAKRITDVDCSVAILAVDTLSIIRRYTTIPGNVRHVICTNIYCPQYPLAAACGRFIAYYIESKISDGVTNEKLLDYFIFFEKKSIARGFVSAYPYAIEAMYDCFPAFQNIPAFLNIFKKKLDDETADIWLNILTESVYQTFHGVSSVTREKSIKRKINPEVIGNMRLELVKLIPVIYKHFDDKKILPLLVLIRDIVKKYSKHTDTTDNMIIE